MKNKYHERRIKAAQNRVQDRVCGDCQACCEIIGVGELAKPTYTICQHQCPTGCGIYPSRPTSCAKYSCFWLDGILKEEEARPDKLGIIFDAPEHAQIENLVCAREVREGAIDSDVGQKYITAISEIVPVYLIYYKTKERKLVTTDPKIAERAQELVWQHRIHADEYIGLPKV